MNTWIKKSSIFVVAGISYLLGQYFRGAWLPNFTWPLPCYRVVFGPTSYCDPRYLDTLGFPLIVLAEYLAVIGLILLFANEKGLRRWFWTSLVYIPIAFGLILWIYPLKSPLGGIAPYSQGVRLFGNLYLLITLGIVLYARLKKGAHNK